MYKIIKNFTKINSGHLMRVRDDLLLMGFIPLEVGARCEPS